MTREQLHAAGEALFGPQWRAPLARALGMTQSHMSHMSTGHRKITPQTALMIQALARKRGIKLMEIAEWEV